MAWRDNRVIERIRARRLEMKKSSPGAVEVIDPELARVLDVADRHGDNSAHHVRRDTFEVPVIPLTASNMQSVFERAVACLPDHMAKRVDIFTSTAQPDGRQTFRDADGQVIWKHPEPGQIQKARPVYRSAPAPATKAANPPKSVELTQAFGAITALAEVVKERMDSIEGRMDDMHKGSSTRRGLSFKGEFQRALDYSEGDVVTRNERLYVAVKNLPAGDSLRDGSPGWVLMVKGVPQ